MLSEKRAKLPMRNDSAEARPERTLPLFPIADREKGAGPGLTVIRGPYRERVGRGISKNLLELSF
jgi:hypothetical protein